MRRKTTLDLDHRLVADARAVLGTRGLKETVDAALVEVVRASRRRELAAQLAAGEGLDFDVSRISAARRWRG